LQRLNRRENEWNFTSTWNQYRTTSQGNNRHWNSSM